MEHEQEHWPHTSGSGRWCHVCDPIMKGNRERLAAIESITVDGHMYVHVAACPCPDMQVRMAEHADEVQPRIIGYTAFECERDMRRMSNGERGCANPEEHMS